MLHKLDVRPLQSLHIGHDHQCHHLILLDHLSEEHGVHVVNIGHDHHYHDHRCDDDHHLSEEHGVLVVNIVIGHPVVQHPRLVSQTLNPKGRVQNRLERWSFFDSDAMPMFFL